MNKNAEVAVQPQHFYSLSLFLEVAYAKGQCYNSSKQEEEDGYIRDNACIRFIVKCCSYLNSWIARFL